MTRDSSSEADLVRAGAARLQALGFAGARVGLVLGSGLQRLAAQLTMSHSVAFDEVPHWPVPRVDGHDALLTRGRLEGVDVVCLSGRVHLYEGWTPPEVVRAVRTLRALGVPDFVLTNAAGGIDNGMRPGDLMVIRDHLNLTGCSPLTGPADDTLGPRFPDQSHVYPAELRELLHAADQQLREGVYAGLQGPSYETPAEVAMLRVLGADAIGMSTVHEAIALNAMGAGIAGVSLISNLAAGFADRPLRHDEVLAAGRQAERRLLDLITAFCKSLPPAARGSARAS